MGPVGGLKELSTQVHHFLLQEVHSRCKRIVLPPQNFHRLLQRLKPSFFPLSTLERGLSIALEETFAFLFICVPCSMGGGGIGTRQGRPTAARVAVRPFASVVQFQVLVLV